MFSLMMAKYRPKLFGNSIAKMKVYSVILDTEIDMFVNCNWVDTSWQ